MKKDYIVLKGADATYTNSRLQWNIHPNAFYRNMSQDGHDDIYMKLVSINFRIATADNDAVDGSCLIDTNLSFGNLSPTSGNAIISIVETYLHKSNGNTQYVSPKQPQHDIILKASKFNTIQLGVKYDGGYMDVSENQANFTAVLEIEYRDKNIKELS